MVCEEKSKVPENPKKTSLEDTQQVVSEEPQQTLSEPSQETPFKGSEETPAEEGCKIKKTILTLLLCAFLFLSGCATIMNGKYQNIPVTSEPPGVKVSSCTGASLITPGIFELARNQNHTLVAEYPGYEPQQKQLKHKLQGCFWGNILICGIISGVVDLVSGASDHLVPDKVHFDFTATGLAIENRKRSYLESHPETTDDVRFAILSELDKKGMTKDELIASLGEPPEIIEDGKYEVFIYDSRKTKSYYFRNGVLKKTQ
jgi:hypothetical protein